MAADGLWSPDLSAQLWPHDSDAEWMLGMNRPQAPTNPY
eukprot:CAMPEP_0180502874 /NCGR_PEP_ID=MMETSP1036_2-20121128/45692_1 /TAXON_ID=632150 /ORGANISM="Azadinium spinosum, Strain 3D9" /LENGTH=38 /DNA_ID= /DNA_START= /DNA_END= /DNA_ORIENTATION=